MKKVNHVHPELQDEIMKWMMDNRYCFNRLSKCMDEFKEYIFSTATGEYLIGGTAVSDFIHTIDAAMNCVPMKSAVEITD